MMRVHDVSAAIHPGMILYPGTPAFQRDEYRSMREGETSNNSRISMGAHVGTHVDAPYHYLKSGEKTESLSLDALVGPARLFRLDVQKSIRADDLRGLDWSGVKRALFRTRMSDRLRGGQFDPEFVYLEGSAAEFLVEKQVVLVGVDSLSIDRFRSPQHPAHHALLGNGVVVIEGLDLSGVEPGDYVLVCAPLKIVGGEAAPARAFLLETDGEHFRGNEK
jgi:arylformamidase